MEAFARAQCYGAFAAFVGEIYELSELELGYLTPSRDRLRARDARFRGIHCYLLRDNGEEMVGSATGQPPLARSPGSPLGGPRIASAGQQQGQTGP